jgi:hypothetical protein
LIEKIKKGSSSAYNIEMKFHALRMKLKYKLHVG